MAKERGRKKRNKILNPYKDVNLRLDLEAYEILIKAIPEFNKKTIGKIASSMILSDNFQTHHYDEILDLIESDHIGVSGAFFDGYIGYHSDIFGSQVIDHGYRKAITWKDVEFIIELTGEPVKTSGLDVVFPYCRLLCFIESVKIDENAIESSENSDLLSNVFVNSDDSCDFEKIFLICSKYRGKQIEK